MSDARKEIARNNAEMVREYREAAERGDTDAQYNLGKLYTIGDGVPLDYKEAVHWYRMAAEQGNPEAQCCLRTMTMKEIIESQNALSAAEQNVGSDHPDAAICMDNLAELYFANNFWDEAKQLCNRAMAIFEKTLGPDHPRVATCLNHLAQHYVWVNKYSDAEQLYKRALSITEKSLGPEHPDTITIRKGLEILDKKRVQDVMDAYDRYENKPWERSMVSKHF